MNEQLGSLIAALPSGPGWAAVGVVVVVIFGREGIFSKKTAEENYWLIGAAARRWQERKRRAVERDRQVESAEIRTLRSEIVRIENNYSADQKRWTDLEDLMREELRQLKSWTLYVSSWAYHMNLKAKQHQWAEYEPLINFAEWLEEFE